MDDRDDYEPEAEVPIEPVTERVRIIGAQPAGAVAAGAPGDDPAVTEQALPGMTVSPSAAEVPGSEDPASLADQDPVGPLHAEEAGRSAPSGRNGDDPLEPHAPPFPVAEPATSVPDMPHWTDPPTGQVPAVLDRRGEEDEGSWSAAGDTGPAWREHQHEWDDSSFDPSLLADDETRVGALEETPVEDRRPWEFDDLSRTAPAERGHEAEDGADGSWWDDEDDPAARPVVPARSAATPSGPGPEEPVADDGAERGVASISSSPLRIGARDQLSSSLPGPGRGRGVGSRLLPPVGANGGEGPGRDMPVAIATGLGFVLLAIVCFELGSVATLALATVVVALAAAEYNKALRRTKRRPAALLVLVGTVAVMVEAYVKGPSALPLLLVLVTVASMVWYLVGADRGSAVQGISVTLLGFVWIGLLGSYAALLLAPSQYPHRHGVAFMLGAVVATVGADVGALAIGSWIGRHPLAPHVSPNKTWEGVIGGGLVAVVVSAAITGQVHPWTVPKAALLGLVVAVVAPVGDLCESLLKRDLGLKDMGSMLPGHGGVLDRVDAILFVLPATYYLVRVLNLG